MSKDLGLSSCPSFYKKLKNGGRQAAKNVLYYKISDCKVRRSFVWKEACAFEKLAWILGGGHCGGYYLGV
jgi:hypothetical protein